MTLHILRTLANIHADMLHTSYRGLGLRFNNCLIKTNTETQNSKTPETQKSKIKTQNPEPAMPFPYF